MYGGSSKFAANIGYEKGFDTNAPGSIAMGFYRGAGQGHNA